MGRSLLNALNNLGVVDQYTEALREMGYKLEDLIEKARLRSLCSLPTAVQDAVLLQSVSRAAQPPPLMSDRDKKSDDRAVLGMQWECCCFCCLLLAQLSAELLHAEALTSDPVGARSAGLAAEAAVQERDASAVFSPHSALLSHCVRISGCLRRRSDSSGCCAGAGRCAGQWGAGPPGSLLPGLHGRPQPACLGLWDPLPVRHVQTGGLQCTTAHSVPHARAWRRAADCSAVQWVAMAPCMGRCRIDLLS